MGISFTIRRITDNHSFRRETLVAGGFVVLWVVLTWPLLPSIIEPALGYGDFFTFVWSSWWTKTQALSLNHPWYSGEILSPVGTMLAYHTLMPLPNLILTPFSAALGEVSAMKLSLAVVSPLTAYVTYRVGLRCGLTTFPAFIAGVVYALSPMILQRPVGGHFNMVYGALILPVAFFFALRFASNQKTKDAVLYGATLGAAILTEPRSAVFVLLLTVPYLVARFTLDRDRSARQWRLGLGLATVTALVLSLPQLWMMYRQNSIDHYSPNQGWLALSYITYSNDISTLFAPTTNLLERLQFDGALRTLGQNAGGEGFVQNFGIGAWLLIAVGVVWARRRFIVGFLAVAMVVGIVLSLGPHIRIAGTTYTPLAYDSYDQALSPLLPFTWLTQVPVLEELRISSLFMFFALFPAALLAGFGVQAILKNSFKMVRIAALALLVGVVLLEAGTSLHFTRDRPLEIPKIYEPIERDRSDSVVVDVPLAWIDSSRYLGPNTKTAREPMFRATQHGHPIAAGNVARISDVRWNRLQENRFYTDLIVLQGGESAQLPHPRTASRRKAFANARKLGVGWVVVWPQASKRVITYIHDLGFEEVARHKGMSLFRAPTTVQADAGGRRG